MKFRSLRLSLSRPSSSKARLRATEARTDPSPDTSEATARRTRSNASSRVSRSPERPMADPSVVSPPTPASLETAAACAVVWQCGARPCAASSGSCAVGTCGAGAWGVGVCATGGCWAGVCAWLAVADGISGSPSPATIGAAVTGPDDRALRPSRPRPRPPRRLRRPRSSPRSSARASAGVGTRNGFSCGGRAIFDGAGLGPRRRDFQLPVLELGQRQEAAVRSLLDERENFDICRDSSRRSCYRCPASLA